MDKIDRLHLNLEMVEKHRPYPGIHVFLDEIRDELTQLFDSGLLEKPLFDELNSRLLLRIAQVENALSPERGLTPQAAKSTIVS